MNSDLKQICFWYIPAWILQDIRVLQEKDLNVVLSTEMIGLIKNSDSWWPQSPPYSGEVITDPVHSRGIRGTTTASLKTVNFRKYCTSRETCKTLDWEVIFGKMLHFILFFFLLTLFLAQRVLSFAKDISQTLWPYWRVINKTAPLLFLFSNLNWNIQQGNK